MPDFVHLHTHTEYSLLDGLSSCPALAKYAAELGMKSLAITDHGVMYGCVDFYKACGAAGIKPIIGMEAYLARQSRLSRDRDDGKPYHLILLAQNQAGHQNLLKLASIAQLEGFYYKPRIDKDVLERHGDGLIVLSACAQGEIPQLIYNGQEDKARAAVRWYQERFPGRFYIELQTHDIPEFDATYRRLPELAQEMQIPLVATNDIHYARRDQAEAHDVLLCIGTGKTVNEANRLRMTDPSYYMRSPQEMEKLYRHLPDALLNTVKIAEQCEVKLAFAPPYHLPKFPVPPDKGTSEEYVRALCRQGMQWRYGNDATRPDYVERLEYELSVIHSMGFDDYFLIVWDLCQAAQRMDIWWNVRGSGAGSVVAYSLGITNVDPFKNRLMFERFLNPGRISMPDIDLDYPDDRRAELIAYTKERYGADHVSAIITFGTLGARAAIRDVGRALDVPLGEVDRLTRLVPNVPGKPVSITEALETISDLKEAYDGAAYIKKLLDTAIQVEGVTRHASTHAAGILISDEPLETYLPLNRPTKAEGEDSPVDRVSQWAMEIVDALGMLKVDFLGLRTLTHMRKTCELIEKEHGRKFDMQTIPYERVPDDPEKDADVRALYDLLATGETTGVFQVEGAGMRRVLREMRPTQFQHIIAVLALYRPGPLEQIPSYIRRMHGEEEVSYHHPIIADLLEDTYGIIIYQEQIMQIAVAMAGYKPGEADMIRKAVAKKKRDLMDKHKQMFCDGAVAKDIPLEAAEAVWADIEFFARYGFNRAHATDYAVITGQTAYLKAHYPLEFMTALMTTERHNTEKLGTLIIDARRTGLDVLRPCINRSGVECTIERGSMPGGNGVHRAIRLGLGVIKNVGDEVMRLVAAARDAGGPFKSLDDLADRVDLRKLNRKTLECLIQAGALDDFGARPALLAVVDALLSASAQTHSAREVGQFSLFGDMPGMQMSAIRLPQTPPPIPDRRLLEWEKELLGTYLSKHPMTDQENELLALSLVNTTVGRIENEPLGQQLTLVGMVQRIRRINTKKGETMAFVTLEGSEGTFDVVAFPRTYERSKDILTPERVVVVSGKLDNRPDREEHPLLVDWIKSPQDLLRPVNNSPYAASGFGAAEEDNFTLVGNGFVEEPPVYGNGGPRETHPAPAAPRATPAPPDDLPPWEAPARPAVIREAPPVPLPAPTPRKSVTPASPVSNNGDDLEATPPPPEEPPAPPATLYITLRRTGNNGADFERLSQLHRLLTGQVGQDHFVVVLEGGGGRVELSFPNEGTCYNQSLREQVRSLVGPNNLRVVMAAA